MVKKGYIFQDDRNEKRFEVLYADEFVVFCRWLVDKAHRIEDREQFEKDIKAGRYEPINKTITLEDEEKENLQVPFTQIDGIGQQTARNLRDNDITTYEDVVNESRERLTEVRGMGETTVDRLKEFVNGS